MAGGAVLVSWHKVTTFLSLPQIYQLKAEPQIMSRWRSPSLRFKKVSAGILARSGRDLIRHICSPNFKRQLGESFTNRAERRAWPPSAGHGGQDLGTVSDKNNADHRS